MIQQPLLQWCLAMAMSTSLLLGGCTSTLVHDDVKYENRCPLLRL
jgi:hypothetical protein